MANFSTDLDTIVNAILGANITAGKIKQIPFGVKQGTTFTYNGEEITLSAIYVNKALQAYFIDMKWDSGNEAIYGIPLKSGINIMEQYTNAPISNIYAFDASNTGGEVRNFNNLVLYMIDPLVS